LIAIDMIAPGLSEMSEGSGGVTSSMELANRRVKRRKGNDDPTYHGVADGIDHVEDAEENLAELGIESFLSEVSVLPQQGTREIVPDILEICLRKFENAFKNIPEKDVSDKYVAHVLQMYQFQGMVCCCIKMCLCKVDFISL
jgi:hypothetical protein